MPNEWEIKSRGHQCARTGRHFENGEIFYTLLYQDKDGFRREDLCEEAWQQRNDNIQPFSFWKSKYQAPPAAEPEPMPHQSAEGLLRDLMTEDDSEHTNARYILAIMLERKKLLKQIERKEAESGPILIYEHVKTGELFLIPDPELRLDEVEQVQFEVAALLGIQAPAPPTVPEPGPETLPSASADTLARTPDAPSN